jgi:redox-sensitive bicupin YhaK (pirin superfamily)
VTYLFEGEIFHRDSLGSQQAIRPGDVNLMVAGRGIVHSERERPEVVALERRLHGLQLWLALPEEFEEVEPAFYHYPSAQIPRHQVNGVALRVLMGAAYGVVSPVKTYSETLYIEADMSPGDELELPEAEERAIYIASGELHAGADVLPEHNLAVFGSAPGVKVTASVESRIAIIGGAKMSERFMEWNFASSRRERIAEAKKDWQERRFPLVPGDEEEFIPFPG